MDFLFIAGTAKGSLQNEGISNHLKDLIAKPDLVGSDHKIVTDKCLSKLDRVKSNPMRTGEYFKTLGLTLELVRHFHFHDV